MLVPSLEKLPSETGACLSSMSLCAQFCKENTVLCDDKFATSVNKEVLAVGYENQSHDITFLLQLVGSSDENSSGTKISF